KCEIGKKAKTGQTMFPEPFGMQFGGEKRTPDLNDLQILPELFGGEVLFKNVKTDVVLGGFKSKAPIAVAAMGSTKVANLRGKAIAEGSALAGIPMVIGENMPATYGKKGMKERIKPYLDSYDGKNGAVIQQGNGVDIKNKVFETAHELGCHGVEIKLGQGAKQGLGGEIKFESKEDAAKYAKMGYHIEKNPDGTFQRHTPTGSFDEQVLRDVVVKAKNVGLPIWVKIGMGRGIVRVVDALEKIKKQEKAKIACLTVDGFGGGTGMSPWLVMNEMSIPSACLMSALKEKPSFDIILAGGYNTGFDVAKGMMLGANGSSMGRSFLIAANSNGSKGVVNYVNAMKTELQMTAAVLRCKSADGMIGRKNNLIALDAHSREMLGVTNNAKEVL
ncbi:alpha-hydroxy-acid oxidizing protein, partial [Candidatus Micrarchaeota archaeon]|nr:alpha-hydroxy-acid oxidizing protein [Candidatus Micrarchaeota archaeon]